MRIFPTSIVIFFCSLFVIVLTSCSGTRHVPEGEYLLKKNIIKVKTDINWKKIKKNIEDNRSLEAQLLDLAKQKPNTKTLSIFKFNLFAYNLFYTKKLNRTKQWLMNTIGEPPEIFDSTLMEGSARQMQTFLSNKGYLNSAVSYEAKMKKKKATALYVVTPGPLYTIDTIIFPVIKDRITTYINDFKNETLLHRNDPLDQDKMDEERTRMTRDLQNWSYYKFSKNDISFEIDTTGKNTQADIIIKVNPPADSSGHNMYFFNNIYVYPDFDPELQMKDVIMDTMEFNHYLFVYRKMNLRPQVLDKVIFMTKGHEYSRKDYDYTINRIADLGVYNFISIRFRETHADSLDCFVYLTPAPVNKISTEIEASNIEDNLGSALRVSLLNRNIRHRATQFEISANGGVEIPIVQVDSLLYNAGLSMNFYIPRFLLLPVGSKRLSRYYNEKTKISLSTNLVQQSKVYSLVNYNFSFGWDWKENREKRHILNPVFVTLVHSFNISPSFQERLDSDRILSLSFSDLLIAGANYNFIYSNQRADKFRNFFVLKLGGEFSGNLFYGSVKFLELFKIYSSKNENGQYVIGQLPVSNYGKIDVDYRRYWILDNKDKKLVGRAYFGIGKPFWNSKVLPYIKQYYAGGPNDIRAWRIRALGPGSYNLQSTNTGSGVFYNQIGDIKLQANLEYRFGIISFFKGAVFADAGNIWNLEKDESKPGAEFQIDRFYNEIALGAGIGLRMDFGFMVARLDFAVPIHDPAMPEGSERWTFNQTDLSAWKWIKQNTVLNLAIGYPFN